MTTGRINQVTIVAGPGAVREDRPVPVTTRPRRSQDELDDQGVNRKRFCPGRGGARRRSATGATNVHPFAPTESPKERSAADAGMRDPGRPAHPATYAPQLKATSHPSRPKWTGIGFGVPPNVLRK